MAQVGTRIHVIDGRGEVKPGWARIGHDHESNWISGSQKPHLLHLTASSEVASDSPVGLVTLVENEGPTYLLSRYRGSQIRLGQEFVLLESALIIKDFRGIHPCIRN